MLLAFGASVLIDLFSQRDVSSAAALSCSSFLSLKTLSHFYSRGSAECFSAIIGHYYSVSELFFTDFSTRQFKSDDILEEFNFHL
jgi:hypothetical protein